MTEEADDLKMGQGMREYQLSLTLYKTQSAARDLNYLLLVIDYVSILITTELPENVFYCPQVSSL